MARPKKSTAKLKALPSSRQLLADSLTLIRNNLGLFIGLILIYFLLSLLLVKGFDLNSNFNSVKNSAQQINGSNTSQIGINLGLYAYAMGSSASGSSQSLAAYQFFLSITISLAAIWIVRQLLADNKVSLKNSFYKGMYPLIPYLLILIIIALELIPAMIGGSLLAAVTYGFGGAASVFEKFLSLAVYFLSLGLSFYLLIGTVFGLYITTLPDMQPIKAIKSAKQLVSKRRLSVGLRFGALLVFMLLLTMVVLLPLIYLASWAVEATALALAGFCLIFFHVYSYHLYRGLL